VVRSDTPAQITPLAFFRVVPLHPMYMQLALAIVTAAGVARMILDPCSGDRMLVAIVFVQMFASSTGFAIPARRGYYDLLLTGGATRLQVAAMHLLLSIAPGIAAWCVLAGAELALGCREPRALTSGSIAALVIVSSVAWAVTVPLPRLSGGLLWLLAIVMWLALTNTWREELLAGGPRTPSIAGVLFYTLCPFVLAGRSVSSADAWILLPGAVVSTVAVATALRWMTRMDIALEASQ